MTSFRLAELKGSIDFGVITIRPDEYDAILERFPGEDNTEGERNYRISDVLADDVGKVVRVAIVRCNEPGLGEAQSVANDLITDLAPECLLAVGIAGGIHDHDFSLGDVIVATYIHDFSVEAVLKRGGEFNFGGGPVPKAMQNLAASLISYDKKLGDWAHDPKIPKEIPLVEYNNPKKYYGPKAWREKVYASLERHFGPNAKRQSPKVVDGPIASSDRLIKNAEYTQRLLSFIRNTKAVEMEVAGVYRATRKAKGKDYLLTTIRGISDVIGFERDDGWTKYACQSAAAFAYAFIKSGLLIPPKSIHEKESLVPSSETNKEPRVETILGSVGTSTIVPSITIVLEHFLKAQQLAKNSFDQIETNYVYPSDCDEIYQGIQSVWNDHIVIAFSALDNISPIPDRFLKIAENRRSLSGLIYRDVDWILNAIQEFKKICLEQNHDTNRTRLQIREHLSDLYLRVNALLEDLKI